MQKQRQVDEGLLSNKGGVRRSEGSGPPVLHSPPKRQGPELLLGKCARRRTEIHIGSKLHDLWKVRAKNVRSMLLRCLRTTVEIS